MLANNKGLTLLEVLVTIAITGLLMAALFSFSVGVQRGSATVRRGAYSGQAAEMALTQLRHELAGALWLGADDSGNNEWIPAPLRYDRVRDERRWTIELTESGELRRVTLDVDDEGNLLGTTSSVVLARNIDEFSFQLPDDNQLIKVKIVSGDFQLTDSIYLRNWDSSSWVGTIGTEVYPQWRPNIRYEPGEMVSYNGEIWRAKMAVNGGSTRPGNGHWEQLTNWGDN